MNNGGNRVKDPFRRSVLAHSAASRKEYEEIMNLHTVGLVSVAGMKDSACEEVVLYKISFMVDVDV